MELHLLKSRVKILYRILSKECPSWKGSNNIIGRREVNNDFETELEVENILFNDLKIKLDLCRQRIKGTTTSATEAATIQSKVTTTPTLDATVSGTSQQIPSECANAVNLTGSWRLDHNGSNIDVSDKYSEDGYACDFHDGLASKWFRFSVDGGNQMLNKCPPSFSCGTRHAYYIDSVMPDVVGQEIQTTAYGSHGGCRRSSRRVSVMRCSSKQGDFIYRHDTRTRPCNGAFCGMYAEKISMQITQA